MKTKNIIKSVCLVLVIAFFAVWAFGGMTLITRKFLRPDTKMRKDTSVGTQYIMAYTLSSVEENESFDASKEAKAAVNVIQKRLAFMGYEGIDVRTMAGNMVRLQLPDTTSVASDVADIVTTTGVIKINNGDETVFTNADIKSGAYLGYDSSTQKCLVELKLNKDAKAKLAEITSSGSYKLTVTVDSSVITAEVSGTEHIKNGKLNVSFSTSDYSKALKLAYCAQTGNINAKLSGESDYSYMIEGTAGDNALMVFALAALTVFVVGCVYLVAANKLMGVAALLTSLLGVIALDFFGATFTWLVVDGAAVAAFGFGIILILAAAMIILYQIKSQYALGKSLRDAIDNGFAYGRKAVLELMLIAVVSGIALWICGGAAKSFGIVLFGSSAIAILCALLLKSVINMIVGMGIENTKVLGLKRGE